MVDSNPNDLGAILADCIRAQDIDGMWWVVKELQGQYENSAA